ncbi:MAG: hypothetical protein K5629_08255 [Eubacteriales bacterium]|nr:hypothetical protein [Eubacteriales bacterium]
MSDNNDNKTLVVTTAIVTMSVVVISAACYLLIKHQKAKKALGGELIKVNYKYEKEFA